MVFSDVGRACWHVLKSGDVTCGGASLAERVGKKKAHRSPRSGASSAVGGGTRPQQDGSRERVAKLERERDEALQKLRLAEQRISELEGVQEKVINQIDWAIDSLQGLRDEGKS